jgi:hypothetical protein
MLLFTCFQRISKNLTILAKTAAYAPRILVQIQFAHYKKVHELITVLPFEGTVENCLRNSRAGTTLQADYELLADSLWTVGSALDMASQGFHAESSWSFI